MKFLAWLLFKLAGWKLEGSYPENTPQSVMIAAPHTSNWDFVYARAAFYLMGIRMNYTIKKEFMIGPLGWMLKSMGAIPIDRKPKSPGDSRPKMVDAMAGLFKKYPRMVVLVTPEGTRKYVANWKTGFYYVALQANVPIILGFLDYPTKTAGIGPTIYPSGNVEEDVETIQAFYRTKTGRFPEQGVR